MTHNRKRAGGGNGAESTIASDFPGQKGPQSTGKRYSEGWRSVGKNGASGSYSDNSHIKSTVFCRERWIYPRFQLESLIFERHRAGSDELRLPDDRILDCAELLLPGQRRALTLLLRIKIVHLTLQLPPRFIALRDDRHVGASYFVTFTLPLLIDDVNTIRGFAVFVLLLSMLILLIARSDLFYQNPVLATLKYKVFRFKFVNPYNDIELKDKTYIGIYKDISKNTLNFTQGALLVAECLADYYRTGKLIVYEYTRESCELVERRIRLFVVTEADLKLLLDELQSVQNPEHWLYRSWFREETRDEWLAHIQSVYQTLIEHT